MEEAQRVLAPAQQAYAEKYSERKAAVEGAIEGAARGRLPAAVSCL